MNAHMADLRRCFDSAGFSNVTTVLASGNVVFDARSAGNATLERKAEVAMARELDRVPGVPVPGQRGSGCTAERRARW